MAIEYVVSVRGQVPSDVKERVARAHAEAILAQRGNEQGERWGRKGGQASVSPGGAVSTTRHLPEKER